MEELKLEDLIIDETSNELEEFVIENTEDSSEENNNSDSPKAKESVADEESGKTPEEGQNSSSTDDKPTNSGGKLAELYSSLAAQLKSSGVLTTLEEEKISSFEDLKTLFAKEIETRLDDSSKSYRKALEKGMQPDEFAQYEQRIQQAEAITDEVLEKEENQKLRFNVIGQDFINRGFTKEEASKFAQRSVDLGEDVQESKEAITRIKTFIKEERDNRMEEAKKEKDSVNTNIKSFIDKSDELIKGIKITPVIKEKLYSQITSEIAKDEIGVPLSAYTKAMKEDPVKIRVMNEYMFFITKGYTDFSKISNSIQTQKSKELDEVLKTSSSALLQEMGQDDTESKFSFENMEIDI